MTRRTRTTTALGLALLATAAPAAARAAAPPHVPVPAGVLQHTVTEITFPASKNTFFHHGLRNERWIGATAGREVVTDLATGRMREECSFTLTVARCWDGPLNAKEPAAGRVYILPGDARLLQSWADIGGGVTQLMSDPRGYHQTGVTTFLGHPAITLAQDAARGPDGGVEHTTVIAEADNHYPLWSEVVDVNQPYTNAKGHHGTEQVDQLTTTKTLEVISPSGVRLKIGRHPHAKVTDDRPAAIAARRKARKEAAARKHRKRPTGYAARSAAAR